MQSRTIKIGMGQLLVEGGEPERNLRRAVELIDLAGQKDCDIVLLPECLDFGWTHPSAKNESQSIPGPLSDILCNAAKDKNIYICAGLTEKDGDNRYNAAVFIDREGKILLKYHKINLLTVEFDFYSVGKKLEVIDTPLGRIGVNICADNYFDSLHIGHTLARMGAEIILSPSSWTSDYSVDETTDPYKEKWIGPYLILAKLYDLAIVGVTSVGYIVGGPYEGKKMIGCSLAVNKNGIINKGPFLEFASELIVADIDIVSRREKGTLIGQMLKEKGYRFDNLADIKIR